MSLTKEQQLAVDKKDTNIIVSAGAGSGKTTVLKTRVLRELNDGININNLIILTFTNNAAEEMKERIRKIIKENDTVKDQAAFLDSAYITTFDSFAGSLVKKYNYLLNINKNFKIISSEIVSLEIDKIIDEIFEEKYGSNDENFIKLIRDFEIKDDKNTRAMIKNYYKELNNILNKKEYLDNYIEKHFSNFYIEECFNKFENMIFHLVEIYVSLIEELEDYTISDKALEFNQNLIANLTSVSCYDDLYSLDNITIHRAGKTIYEGDSTLTNRIKNLRDKIKNLIVLDKKSLIDLLKSTKEYNIAIIDILKELDKKLNAFKENHNSYEFSDIAFKAIELVKNNEEIRNEIKNSTYEIMIDEYQDTNDIQEEFISYISNNNVYMVGDVKQSIYRFRNANPTIFKTKYDNYSKNNGGFKIDLNKNFRSRDEVVNNINLIFDNIMFDDVGGANYKLEHRMIRGNEDYFNHQLNKDYSLEILAYDSKNTTYKKNEIEAFIIADDILKRINNKESVTYVENNVMKSRDIMYQDFCILIDKSKNFELIKKVLEYHNIPANIYKDISIKDEDEIYILKNLIKLLIKIKNNEFDMEFKHSFISVARSYVAKINDDLLFKIVNDNKYKETDIYKKLELVSSLIGALSNKEILLKIIDEFDIINKLKLVGDIEERLTKLEYFINEADNLNNFGMNIYDMGNLFDTILNGEDDIKMETNKDSESNAVKIMTIHGSKGLEYPYVYLPYLDSDYTKAPTKSSFKFSKEFGFITPFYKDGNGLTFLNSLEQEHERKEITSEKIRLFYVALTRAKEKIIMINEFNEKIDSVTNINSEDLLNVKSIADMLSLLKMKLNSYIKQVDLEKLNITSNYNLIKDNNYHLKINNNTTKINIENITMENKILESKHFSKSLSKIINKEFKERLDFGTYMHYVFEVYNFQTNNLDELDIDDKYKEHIRKFLEHEEVKNISNAKAYKEYEIMFNKDGNKFHGFIDLLLEYDDHFDIIDYKLSNIESPEYIIQLSGYKDYIESKYNKPCNIYLYSIKKDILKKL